MKPSVLGLALVVILIAAPAQASPQLAGQWGEKAAQLYAETVHLRSGEAATSRYEDEIARFSTTSARLAEWIDAENGPEDLGCIFRGMAQEAETQLLALESDQRGQALERLTVMFSDAEMVAAAAIAADRNPREASPSQAGTCPARPLSRTQYLTEQP